MRPALQVDTAFQGTDREAVEMAAHLLRCDGLFLGSSAAMNCVGAVKARPCPDGHLKPYSCKLSDCACPKQRTVHACVLLGLVSLFGC